MSLKDVTPVTFYAFVDFLAGDSLLLSIVQNVSFIYMEHQLALWSSKF